jgi:nucleoid DNA-binding protein
MTYDELIKQFAKKNNLEIDDAREFIDGFFSLIKYSIATNDKISFPRFGTFTPKTYQSKLRKNKKTGKVEIVPEKLVPHFTASKARPKPAAKKKNTKPKSENKSPLPVVSETVEKKTSKSIPIWKYLFLNNLILLTIALILFLLFEGKIKRFFNYKIQHNIKYVLNEKGLTYDAIQELVDSKYFSVLEEARTNTMRLKQSIATQLVKIRKEQKMSLAKLNQVEKKLQLKISKLIKPSLKKRRKKAKVKIILYTVKKNDTLWSISKKYLKNPYSWVGVYKTNGKKIKDPNLIYPGEKIFIPVIKEY